MSALRKFVQSLFSGREKEVGKAHEVKKPSLQLVASAPANKALENLNGAETDILRISNFSELMGYKDVLYSKISMATEFHVKICPVQLAEDHTLFALIVDEKEQIDELIDSIKDMLMAKGYRPAQKWLVLAPFNVMFELSRSGLKRLVSEKKNGERATSSLYMLFEEVARFGIAEKSSDLHFEIDLESATSPVRFDIDSQKIYLKEFYYPSQDLLACVGHMFNTKGNTVSENVFNMNLRQHCNIPLTIGGKKYEFRFASTPSINGILVVMRIIDLERQPEWSDYSYLGHLPDQIEAIERAVSKPKGGFVICGRVGSGKSRLLHTILSKMPNTKSIITIEDPVEDRLPNATQIPISRSMDDESSNPFLSVSRTIKRLNPNIVAAGEVRDKVSGQLFRDIIEGGVYGFCTVHAGGVVEALNIRLVSKDLGVGREIVATPDFLNLIVFQALVRTLCTCKRPAEEVYDEAYLSRIEEIFPGLSRKTMRAANKEGCKHCNRKYSNVFNGFGRRIAVAEIWRPDYGTLFLIRDGRSIEVAQRFNMMREAGFDEPITKGKTALEVAMYHVHQGTMDPKEVEAQLGNFEDYYDGVKGAINV